MTKDFKTQAATDNTFSQYGMGWMLGGVAIGLLVGLILYSIRGNNAATPTANTPSAQTAAQAPTTNAGNTSNVVQNNGPTTANNLALNDTADNAPAVTETAGFSYHAVLPQLEVGVPIALQEPPAPAAKDSKATKPTPNAKVETATKPSDKKDTPAVAQAKPNGANGFQAGSYKTAAQATALQARLKKNGLNTRVEQAQVNGGIMFRVRVGPATSQEMLDKWQQTLSGMGISPLPVRM
jgi:cell division protein FtsN